MNGLDDKAKITASDKKNFLGSINMFPKQCSQAWEEAKPLVLPEDYKHVEKVVLNGMGGSGLGLHIVDSVFFDELKVPVEVFNSYSVPNYVDEKTLFLASSYSGTTEEIIYSLDEAEKRKAKIMGITGGGRLEELFREKNIPFFKINPINNPSGQPRMGLGYSITGIMGLLSKAGIVDIKDSDFEEIQTVLAKNNQLYGLEVPEAQNLAKMIAQKLFGKIIILTGGEFLAGSLHAFRNQFHENAKNYCEYHILSELNHHLMESFSLPKTNPDILSVLAINSNLYSPLIQKRFTITNEIIEKNHIPVTEYKLSGKTKLAQAYEMIHFGEYVNFYLSFLNEVDPASIPWVDLFKERLSQ